MLLLFLARNLLELNSKIMICNCSFFLARFCSRPGLLLWTESSVCVCQCDERKLYRRHYGSRQRKVRLLYRPLFGCQFQYIYWRQLHLKEERTPSTGQEGLYAGRYVSFSKVLIQWCQENIRIWLCQRGLTGMGGKMIEMFYSDTPVLQPSLFKHQGAALYRSVATHFI